MRRLFWFFTLLVLVLLAPRPAAAHATLVESDPAPNAVLAEAPAVARLRFSEPLEPSYSRVVLTSAESGPIATAPSRVDPADPYVLLLELPPLAEGVYSLQWRTLSTADGHTMTGMVPFVIGDPAAANAPLVLPPAPPDPLAAPPLSDVAARWLTLLGLTLALGGLCFRLLVWQPTTLDASGAALFERVARRIEIGGGLLALLGASGALLLASATAGGDALTFALRSRVGLLLALRIALIGLLALVLISRDRRRAGVGLVVGSAALLTLSLLSHSAVSQGRDLSGRLMTISAIGFDLAHLLATCAWIGGLAALLATLLAARRAATRRSGALTQLVAHFTGMATAAVIVLATTGTFAALRHLSAISELWTTTYGRALSVKLGLFGLLLAVGGFNRWWLHPRLARGPEAAGLRTLRRSVGFEIGLSVVLLATVGLLTASPPPETSVAQAEGLTQRTRAGNTYLVLQIVRNDTAGDIYALTAYGLPPGVEPEAVIRASMPAHSEEITELQLARVEPNRWGARGALLTMPGQWHLETILRARGMDDVRHTFIIDTSLAPSSTTPSAGAPLWAVLLTLALMLTALSQLPIARRWQGRFQSSALLMVALAFGAATVPYYLTRAAERTNPLSPTPEVLAAGKAIYERSCASCHGLSGRGDGPAAATLPGLPADFTIPHFATHTDAQVFEWIKNGKPGTAMPAFGDQLSEEEIWQVITYLRELYRQAQP
ncbi:CopD family protein [Kallotenue papyrolyticum]|uniref:CopD family protein n=1 Tax=Kallotenue papyrolyticum TaxID=1325125 RepID=UPI00047862B2|nr:CopD family protein [Kallotenue papyrolyticum]